MIDVEWMQHDGDGELGDGESGDGVVDRWPLHSGCYSYSYSYRFSYDCFQHEDVGDSLHGILGTRYSLPFASASSSRVTCFVLATMIGVCGGGG